MNRGTGLVLAWVLGLFWLLGIFWALGPPYGPESWPLAMLSRTARVLLVLAAGLAALAGALAWLLARASRQNRQLARRGELLAGNLRRAISDQKALLDNNDAMIMQLDDQGRYVAVNRRGLEYLGCRMADIAGLYVEEHLTPDGAARMHEYFENARRGAEIRQHREPWNLAGKLRYIDFYLKAMEPGEAEGFLLILRDRSDEKLLDEKLWQTERLASLGMLAAGVAHQINNPLGILLGFAEMSLGRIPPGGAGHRELGIIMEQGRECQRIVDGLLNFTRLSCLGTGHGDVLASLKAVLQTLDGLLANRNLLLELDLPPKLPRSAADGGAMQQVFLNLISNAMDAMPKGGKLEISAREVAKAPRQKEREGEFPPGRSYLELSFTDDGPGIGPEHLNRIFDPFYTTKPVGQGTGLGLSVAYALLADYQGLILAQSPPPGREKGARFILRLPVAAPGAAKPPGPGGKRDRTES